VALASFPKVPRAGGPPSGGEHRWPCDSCGSDLRFAPGQSSLVCPHCGHVQTIPEADDGDRRTALAELDLRDALRDALPERVMEEVRTTSCPSCGAMVEFDGTTFSKECQFCASPVVVDAGSHRHIKPQALVPFVLTEAEARGRMVAWLGSLWFAPNKVVEYARKGRKLDGMYVPFWTFDAATRSRYRGQRGIYYYESQTVTVNVNGRSERREQRVRKTRWQPVSGQVARNFDDVLVLGSKSLPYRLGDELTPWDLTQLVPYRPDYLSGFHAEGYTVALAEANEISKAKMAAIIQRDVARDIGGDEQRIDQIETQHGNQTFKHILLPVWLAAYRYGGKSYRFLVNGQTGEVQGERPYSVWKIAFAVLLALIAAAAVAYLVQTQGGTVTFQTY
jgi:predicted RNA-binding Zn-ribbon protein involved in translation (DUF1610 family)